MKNKLEIYIAEKLNDIGIKARPTKASGASTEIGDVINNIFYVECKLRNTKNATINRKTWIKLLGQKARKDKWSILALENVYGDRFIVMDAEEFFNLYQKLRDY